MNPAKPTAIKIVQGNPGKRALPKDEPQPEAVPADLLAPAELSPAASQHWAPVLAELVAMRVVTRADLGAVADYCRAIAERDHCQSMLDTEGYVDGSRTSPWWRVRLEAQKQVDRFRACFGMTPSDRTKVKTLPAPKKANPFSAI